MNILAIDSSTEACSAALLRDDGEVFSEFEVAPRQHTRLLPRMMDAVLGAGGCSREAITHCAFANGPGAFTGIRISASIAQGIGIALDIPLAPISTLAVLAQANFDRHPGDSVLVALDARMSEVYWALYRRNGDGLANLQGQERLNRIDDVFVDSMPDRGAGHGWSVGYPAWKAWCDDHPTGIDADLLPDARALVKLARRAVAEGQTAAAADIRINYLRNEVADKSARV